MISKGRHTPDFSQIFALTQDDHQILSMRGLNADAQDAVGAVYAEGRSAVQTGRAKDFLSGLDTQSLSLLQEAASLAEPVDVASLSEEGAENLLLAPTEAVDLNGDGMIQTGASLGFQFPPVNASPELRAAWEKTTAGMSEGDAATLALMIGGPSVAVDGSDMRMTDFSGNFNWNAYMKQMISANEAAAPYNTAQQTQKINDQLQDFWSALKDQGVA
ncbi:hypothetical protein CWS72_19870 [Telmatospirillum siberiense]|uniref:Uncharacterized protein n=1 Tax=Telmatospirillum siberiense TaxID=382514 RepID=A0A2N3PQR5_9PROT|nr:hypothetical protein CWS72_19870 [Telmatospirillum siberiense]